MENHEFDTVKAEKANAIANYRRLRNIAKLFQVLEVFVAITLISWSSTRLPSVFNLSREYLIRFSVYLFNPHVVFVIGNIIVASLFVYYRHFDVAESESATGTGIVSEEFDKHEAIDHNASVNGTGIVSEECEKYETIDHNAAINGTGIVSEDFDKHETIDHNASVNAGAADFDNEWMRPQPEMESADEDKQIVCMENAVVKTECEAAAAAIETAAKQIKRFQRTQSAKLKRDISMKPQPQKEYRRSETEIRRLVVTSPNHGRRALASFESVERLTNEEFRMTVEAFIEKQQSFLKSQKYAEISK